MVEWVASSLKEIGVERPVIVIGHGGDLIRDRLGDGYDYVEQTEQLGTGHAALVAADKFRDHKGPLIVAAGDTPLLTAETLSNLTEKQARNGAAAAMAYCRLDDPAGYGRVIVDNLGRVEAIVEDKDCSPQQLQVKEINPALYCFDSETLFRLLPHIGKENKQGEYYLTDIVAAIRHEGGSVEGQFVDDFSEFLGINNRWQLAQAAQLIRMRILKAHAMNGVTIVDPNSTYIEGDVTIGVDTVMHPMTVVEGKTNIGGSCVIGPNTWIKNSEIEDDCRVFMSHVDQVHLHKNVRCGPFANLRPESEVGRDVRIGNFVEIKNSQIGDETKISHLSYIGDSKVGQDANIGAGTITCNFDGFAKQGCSIGDGAFVGSSTILVAPVKIGDGGMTAAGSVITSDVPDDAMGIARGRQETKEEWAKRWRDSKTDQEGQL
jgi:bifunctional UDP-N-acetylglucosamine pyrophosphorylase/glucosamine-1-phosphate N-acetyltransferase